MTGDTHRCDETTSADSVRASVVMVTYNHERFIARAIDSVLAQQTNFGFELIISEDRSSDASRSIIEYYAEKHHGKIRLMLSERNLNSNAVAGRAIMTARGEYVALMDGDDYLSSPLKLQKQVEFLDRHPDHAMCYHNADIIRDGEDRIVAPFVKAHSPQLSDLRSILAANPVPGSSSMFRTGALRPLPDWFAGAPFGDWSLFIVAGQRGPIGYIDETLSVYRMHAGGAWSGLSRPAQYHALMNWYEFLLRHLPAHLSDEIRAAHAHYRTHNWYVADVGEDFLALHDAGKRFPDGRCERHLRLHVEALKPMTGVRIVMSNPTFDPCFAGNRIEVQVNAMTQTRADLAPGESFKLEFPRSLAEGDVFTFEARSTAAAAGGGSPQKIGFSLLKFEPIVHDSSRRRTELKHRPCSGTG